MGCTQQVISCSELIIKRLESSSNFLVLHTPADTGRKLNVHKTFRRRPRRLLNVLCMFNLRPVSTGMYAILKQTEEKNQGLFFSISRLSKKDLSVPILEFAAAHIAANSLGNTRYPINIFYRWSHSMVVPYWLHEKQCYK